MNDFAYRLKAELEKNDMDQKELAVKTGITPATISRYMTGKMKPSAENVKLIAIALYVSTDYLLGISDIKNPQEPLTIAAHHDGEEFTEEENRAIELFKRLVREDRENKK